MLALQELLDEWVVRRFTDRGSLDTGYDLRRYIDYMFATVAQLRLQSLVWVVSCDGPSVASGRGCEPGGRMADLGYGGNRSSWLWNRR
jgi:hypothetical protein